MTSRSALVSLALLAGLGTFTTLPAAASATCPNEAVRPVVQTEASMSQSILCLVNEERAAAGIGTVYSNPQLEAAALVHSRDMVSEGFFAHTSPEGIDFVQRISDTGYTRGASSWLAGENLAWGSGLLSTPAQIVLGWMKSPPHRANLLNGQFREIGIAAVRGTPQAVPVVDGVTVTSEYGYRGPKKANGAKKAKKRMAAALRKRSARRR